MHRYGYVELNIGPTPGPYRGFALELAGQAPKEITDAAQFSAKKSLSEFLSGFEGENKHHALSKEASVLDADRGFVFDPALVANSKYEILGDYKFPPYARICKTHVNGQQVRTVTVVVVVVVVLLLLLLAVVVMLVCAGVCWCSSAAHAHAGLAPPGPGDVNRHDGWRRSLAQPRGGVVRGRVRQKTMVCYASLGQRTGGRLCRAERTALAVR